MTKEVSNASANKSNEYIKEDSPSSSRRCIHQMLRTQVSFRRALQRSVKRHHYGITFEMFQVLSILWYKEGVTQQELAQSTAKNKASLTSLLANLEKKGFVRREEGSSDRRNKLVYLTEAGHDLQDQVMPGVYEVYNCIEKELGKERLDGMHGFLCDLEKALKKY